MVTVVGPDGSVCDASVTARLGSSSTQLMVLPGGNACEYVGPYEQAGTFTVTASKPGFRTATTEVTVPQGDCHVEGQNVTLTLVAESMSDGGVE
jgi:hypothetical protein